MCTKASREWRASYRSLPQDGRQEFCEVVGQDGRLEVSATFLPGKESVRINHYLTAGQPQEVDTPSADEYRLMVKHFSDCILRDQEPLYGAEEAAAKLGDIQLAESTLQQALEIADTIPDSINGSALRNIAVAAAKLGKWRKARSLTYDLNISDRVDALRTILKIWYGFEENPFD